METYCHCLSMTTCSQMGHRACNGLNLSSHSRNGILRLLDKCYPARKCIVSIIKITYCYTRRNCVQVFHEVLTLSVHLEFMTSFVIEQSKHLESYTRWRQLLSLKVCPSLLTWIKAPPRDSGSLHDIWFMLIKSPTTVRISVVETTFSSI